MTLTPSKPDAMGRFPATPPFALDAALTTLSNRASAWVAVPLERKIEYLAELRRRTMEVAEALVADAIDAKQVGDELAGEDWVGGVLAQMRLMRLLERSLRSVLEIGTVAITDDDIRFRSDGQAVVRVLPSDRWDSLVYSRWTADVWLDPQIGPSEVRDNLGGIHTKPETARSAVVLVLGAGNQASIAPADTIHQLFVEGHVALLKLNPVNDYVGPHVEYAFGELIRDGFVRTAYGGSDTGRYLTHHDLVDEIHITGSTRTFDIIVFGEGPDGAARKTANEPVLGKPITGELGCVSPIVIVPGTWSTRAIRYHAEHVATQLLQNGGFNCTAAKALVLSSGWEQKDDFLAALRRTLLGRPNRLAYYPGAEERFDRFADAHDDVEMLGVRASGIVPPALIHGLDPNGDHPAFNEEAFCSIAAVVELDEGDPAAFLRSAVAFCNDRLEGTLSLTVIIDPKTEGAFGGALDAAIADLRYGTVGINIWGSAGFPLGQTPWGGFPGAPLNDIQSGAGFVHNAMLVDRPHKTVIRAPFVITPKPPWFVTHGNATKALRAAAELDAAPSVARFVKAAFHSSRA